jgi:hypothetical protein
MMNLQGLHDEFESATIAFLALSQYQSQQPCINLDVERSRREAGFAVMHSAQALMDSVDEIQTLKNQ